MRSIKTVIRENGLFLGKTSSEWSTFPWICTGMIRSRSYAFGGDSQRDAVNQWLEIRNLLDPPAAASRSSSITNQE